MSLEEVAAHAGHKTFMEVDDNISHNFGNPNLILDEQLRPDSIQAWGISVNKDNQVRRYGTEQYEISVFMR